MAGSRRPASWGSAVKSAVNEAAAEPAVAFLAEEWQAIAELGAHLADKDWDLPSECPGWAVKDLVSHMIGTERSLMGESAPPSAPPADHVRNPVGASNEAWVAARRAVPAKDVLAEFSDVTARRLVKLSEMPPERWDEVGPSPVGQVPYREFMAVRAMDCWIHEQDMRVATGRPGHIEGPVAELALRRIASAMPFVVAKKAAAPDGSAVLFELLKSPMAHIGVVVRDGRGVIQDEVPDPTAEIQMDAELFWRVGCGRVTGEAALDAGIIGLRGDLELASRVVRNMAFMI